MISCSEPITKFPWVPKMNLKRLEIMGCEISEVEKQTFAAVAETLEALHLINNSLKEIPQLDSFPKLISLSFDRNEISNIPENIFQGLPQLRHLRLQYNKICTLPKNAFVETKPKLELIDLSGNCFQVVPSQNIHGFSRLMYLDFSENRIVEIGPLSFMKLQHLKELRLNDNGLTKLASNAFVELPQLKKLYLCDNNLSDIDSKMLQAFKQLEILDLSQNKLEKAPSFKGMVNLDQLRLDFNKIQSVDADTFGANVKLELVSFQNNQITKMDKNSLESLEQLSTLLLANNSLTNLDGSMFASTPNLQNLNLHRNNISSIDNSTFVHLPRLTVLDLASNGLEHVGSDTFLKQSADFYFVDLSNNKITGLEKNAFNKKVSNILLTGNPLVCDSKMDWFVTYLVINQVRTARSNEPEIKCTAPEKFAGVRLKDFMIKKSSETLASSMQSLGLDGNAQKQKNFLTNLFPGLANLGDIQNLGAPRVNC